MLRRALVPLVLGPLRAVPATASAEIDITFIRYNPAGPDTGSNASLNKEYVTLHNNGRRAKVMTGWRVHDNQHHSRLTDELLGYSGECVSRRDAVSSAIAVMASTDSRNTASS
jgi:hypothetical protein